MSGLMDMILNTQNGGAVEALAKKFGISTDDAMKAVTQMAPKLGRGVQDNMASSDGLNGLLGALQGGNHQRYLDQPERLDQADAVEDGNNILGHILGSKDASRQVASEAAVNTGLDVGVLKQMLPLVATLVMGGLSKRGGALGAVGQAPSDSGLGGMLGSFLDADKDGSVADDLLGMARKFF